MSKDNNENMQDYLDLLNEYAKKQNNEAVSFEEKDGKKTVKEEKSSQQKTTDDISIFFEKEKVAVVPDSEVDSQETASEEKTEEKGIKKLVVWLKNLPKWKKAVLTACSVILVIAIVLISIVGAFVGDKFNLLGNKVDENEYNNTIYDDVDMGSIEIDIGSAGFKQSLIDWATQGNENHMYSKNVINVLLIGADSRDGINEGNTDVMMLISVNKKTKTLKMISLLRDSYLYIEGNNYSTCTKLNAAFSMGGPECLIKTIENNYKISIDNYLMVNFESFKDIVDAMGGITVDVQEYEAKEIESYFNFSMPYGDQVKLSGKQALAFCRIRKCDSDGDVSRTRRQRQVIDSMMNRILHSSIAEINKYIDVFLPYVSTGFKKTEILSLGLSAVTGGWAKYERTQISVPVTKYDDPNKTAVSGDADMWIWVVDYEKAAHDLQIEIYGESNIVLSPSRVSIIDIYRGATYSGELSSEGSSSNSNNKTTVPSTTEENTNLETTENGLAPFEPITEENEPVRENETTDTTDATDTNQGEIPSTENTPTEVVTSPETSEPTEE